MERKIGVIRLIEAYEKYAAGIDKPVTELTMEEKQMALLVYILDGCHIIER